MHSKILTADILQNKSGEITQYVIYSKFNKKTQRICAKIVPTQKSLDNHY